MLRVWKQYCRLEPQAGGPIVRIDGSPVDAAAKLEMDRWYRNLLRFGPQELLDVTDHASKAILGATSVEGEWEVNLPAGMGRVGGVRMEGWLRDAEIVTDERSPQWRMQGNRFASASHPTALWLPGEGKVRVMVEMSIGVLPRLASLRGVTLTEGIYRFDPRALGV